MAQTPAKRLQSKGNYIPHTPVAAVTAGDVVLIGTIPFIADNDIAAAARGDLASEGVYDVPKDASTFAPGDAVYWNSAGDPVGGTAGSGAATSTPSAYLMGLALETVDAAATMVEVKLTAAKRTTTIAGSVTADDITGSDASLGIAGKAGAGGGAGGIVAIVAGAGHTNGAGGAAGITGGAGAGTGAGGAVNLTGGASGAGATGNGGAASVIGGAAASTNGTGGAVAITGGAGSGTGAGGAVAITSGASGAGATGNGGAIAITAGAAASTNGNGGSITLTPGALAGTGYAGKIHLDGFVAGWTAQTIDMADAAVTLTRATLTGNFLLVDPNSSGASENLLLPPEADMVDVLLIIKNTGGEHIALQNDAAGAIGTIEDAEFAMVHCDGTNWKIIQAVETT